MNVLNTRRLASYFTIFSILTCTAVAAFSQEPAQKQKLVEQGIAIEFATDSLRPNTKVMAGEDVNIQFKVTDTTSGTPVKGLSLSAWLTRRAPQETTDITQCREKIRSYLNGSLRARPDVDLNSYYILTLNKSPDISVIDPLLGFGGSKLLTLVMMKSPGEDWVLTADREKLFVTLPLVNQVAVIDVRSWKVMSYIDTGVKPTSIALQPDQKYVWVGNDGAQGEASGVTVIDAGTLKVAAQISTGAGRHEIVLSGDNRFAFVSNRESGTVSVIDVHQLAKLKDVKVGPKIVSMVSSGLSKAVYALSETDGSVAVINSDGVLQTTIKSKPGNRVLRFAPGGRYGFLVNTAASSIEIFDAASNRLVHDVKVGKAPDQVTFSDTFAFVRSLDSESVSMIRLVTVGNEIDLTEFPGGQGLPGKGSTPVRADSIVQTPEGNSVIVANPVDKVLYYYSEGMAAPMGNFQNYRREPLAVAIVDRSLRETEPGVYSTTVKLPASGKYDVAFLTDAPRISNCFQTTAETNPRLKEETPIALRLEHELKQRDLPVGQDVSLRFKLIDTKTNKAKTDLNDVRVLTFSAPNNWQRRDFAKSLGDGNYEVNLNVPESGVYTIWVESVSMGVRFRDLPSLTLHTAEEKK